MGSIPASSNTVESEGILALPHLSKGCFQTSNMAGTGGWASNVSALQAGDGYGTPRATD